jgi:four helix bundle protein
MDPDELKVRTKKFALNVMELTEKLPHTRSGDVLGRQLLRSATSVGANYRAACRARSRADFISKVSIVEEESDESLYWLELIAESHLLSLKEVDPLVKEANQLTAMLTASARTARRNR